ncbi:uncharacterized protein LOC132903925 [Amyelois transitella]|uniref:uncharacterized protein LOC132903925 n=1 Tax=Amyelois transitella TaxID=680683 RepID=UPI00298F51F6|nr:uncharacterized protein LOC132903925 [Amyelois transitella]
MLGTPITSEEVPEMNFRKALRRVSQGYERLRQNLVLDEPLSVVDPAFHYGLILGVVDAAATRLTNSTNLESQAVYLETLENDLPFVYQAVSKANQQLEGHLDEVENALKPLVDLMNDVCVNLDDKSCNILVQHYLGQETPDHITGHLRLRAVEVLRTANELARRYLKLNERFTLASTRLAGLFYTLHKVRKLSKLADLLHTAIVRSRLTV